MTDLIQRLAEGPGSRELSDEFLLAMNWREDPEYPGAFSLPDGLGSLDEHDRPSPTESVDDALALVPEGWQISEMCEGLNQMQGQWFVLLHKRNEEFTNNDIDVWATGENPLPRAICLAVLRA